MRPRLLRGLFILFLVGYPACGHSCINDREVLVREHQFISSYSSPAPQPDPASPPPVMDWKGIFFLAGGVLLALNGLHRGFKKPGD